MSYNYGESQDIKIKKMTNKIKRYYSKYIPKSGTMRFSQEAYAEPTQPLQPVVFGHAAAHSPRYLQVVCVHKQLSYRL